MSAMYFIHNFLINMFRLLKMAVIAAESCMRENFE
jgi:hypothetical protein